jgi:hypothetical protein
MGFSADVLRTSLQHLVPGYQETFTTWHPLWDKIVEGKKREKLKGPWLEFVLIPEGPGKATPMYTGDEKIQSRRRQSAVRGSAYCATVIYSYEVPLQDLRDASDAADIAKIIESYPERSLMDFKELLAKQFSVGGTDDAGNFITLNGDRTYDPRGRGARSGIINFEAAEDQTATVFGVAKNSIEGWHNQQSEITSFQDNGRAEMRECYWDCEEQGGVEGGAPDIGFSDRKTYANYVKDLDDQVQIVDRTTGEGDRSPRRFRKGIQFLDAVIYQDRRIKASEFTTAAAVAGVCYLLASDTWHMIYQGGSGPETNGNFELRGPIRVADKDAVKFEYVYNGGMYNSNLRNNGVIVGGGRI